MRKPEHRRWTVRQHHLVHERRQIDVVVGKPAHIALARITQEPLRTTLPAPVQHRHSEAARPQVAHGLVILLDELGTAGEQAHRSLASRRRLPARTAQTHAIARLEHAGHDAFRHRIGGSGDKVHRRRESTGARAEPPYSSRPMRLNAGRRSRGVGASPRNQSPPAAVPLLTYPQRLRAPCGSCIGPHMEVACRPHPGCAFSQVRPRWADHPHVAQGGYAMRTFDLAPLYRSTVGFDRLFSLLDGFESAPGYPPYNIERTGENDYRVTVAVAGFGENELTIEAKENTLTIKGNKQVKEEKTGEVLYQGIAARAFERVFQLADHVQVKNASLENGLLHVDLVREIPEAKKPRQIPIGNGKAKTQTIHTKAA